MLATTYRPSALARRNPTVKAGLLLGLGLATFTLNDPLLCGALALAGLLAALVGARVSLTRMGLFLIPFVTYGVGLVLVNATTRGDDALWHVGGVQVTSDGALIGLAYALRGVALGGFTLAFLASTPPRELMSSLMRHARLSPRYAFALLAGHRALLQLPERWVSIRRAHAQRHPPGRRRVRGMAGCAFALLAGAIRDADRIALALETRGLGAGPRTEWVPSRLTRLDAAVAAVGCAALVGFVWLAAH